VITAEVVAERLASVRASIAAAGADPAGVTVVAVTKGFGPEVVEAAVAAGLADVGESYAQEMVPKVAALEAAGVAVRWHFVGRVQSNKIRQVAAAVDCWHSIDRPSVGAELARRRAGARVLVQVNISGEPQKGGCEIDRTAGLVADLRAEGLDVTGLMGIGPAGDPEASRPAFRRLVRLADDLGLPDRSIGMSNDVAVAAAEGATIVRIGRALFGERPHPRTGDVRMRN
jgi:PLP dependent protein